MFVCIYVCMYVCMYLCIYVCMYVYMYVYITDFRKKTKLFISSIVKCWSFYGESECSPWPRQHMFVIYICYNLSSDEQWNNFFVIYNTALLCSVGFSKMQRVQHILCLTLRFCLNFFSKLFEFRSYLYDQDLELLQLKGGGTICLFWCIPYVFFLYYKQIQGVPGGMCQTSGGYFLC